MRKHSNEFQSVRDFSASMAALGEAAGYPSDKTRERQERNERRRHIALAVTDLMLQPLVEMQKAHAEQAAQSEEVRFSDRMTDFEIRQLADRGEGVIVYPFRN